MDGLTQEKLKEYLTYNPKTGHFFNKKNEKVGWFDKSNHAKTGYIRIKIKGVIYRAHRLAWLYTHGYVPEEIDHINREGTDNRLINLREADRILNNRNKNIIKTNSSGITGVSLKKKKGRSPRWVANIGVDGKLKEIGSSLDFFETCCKRKSAELYYGY